MTGQIETEMVLGKGVVKHLLNVVTRWQTASSALTFAQGRQKMSDLRTSEPGYFIPDDCDLAQFAARVSRELSHHDAPQAKQIESNIPLYDMQALRTALQDPAKRRALMAEWAHVLRSGAGVIVLKSAYADTQCIDAATKAYDAIIAAEKVSGAAAADHFSAGTNDRIWNSLQKLCETDPDTYLNYFGNPVIDAACEAWLGPYYQMTAQINLVHPGGPAQKAHRDYHLGFQTAEVSAQFPAHVHDLSPLLTLQGGIAHCDMSVESGPTKFLPFSQTYLPGYVAWRRDDFRDYFEQNFVQLPLSKGDAVFFNPAIFHAAGENRSTDVHRMVNLLQVSSAFGRAMESIDRQAMCRQILAPLREATARETLTASERDAVIAATAEGYSFPTNLDNDPPVGGLAPQTQQSLLREAVDKGWSEAEFAAALKAQVARQRA